MSEQSQTPAWDKSHGSTFENFALDLNSFTRTGQYPSDAGQDVKYGIELQFQRLKEKNLRMEYNISPRGLLTDEHGISGQWQDDKYITNMEFRTCNLSRKIYRGDRKVYEKDQHSDFYQYITDTKDSNAVADELYSCPNCGAVSKISVLQSGCPYCNTYFSMNELFPKVTNYYFLQDVSMTTNEFKKTMFRVMTPCILLSIIGYTIYMYNHEAAAKEGAARIISALIPGTLAGILFGALVGYVLWAIVKVGSIFVQAGKAMPKLVNMAGSRKQFVSFMSQYSPDFSYEYFVGKVVSMMKMIIYSSEPGNLPIYEGAPLGNRFQNVVESSFTGAVALKNYGVQGNDCCVMVDIYLENLYDNGKSIKTKEEKICVELRRNAHKPIDMNFSIERIHCKSCGGSFNAAKMRNCPHCGTRYEIGDDDWIITKIKV